MKILKLAIGVFLTTAIAWGIQTAWLKRQNSQEPSKIERRQEAQRVMLRLEYQEKERDLRQQYLEKKHLATGATVYDRIYNTTNQTLVQLIEREAKEALPENWSCEVRVEEFTNFILLITQPHGTRETDPESVSKYLLPIIKYCGFCLSNIAVLDHTHTSYLFFDEETLKFIGEHGSLAPPTQKDNRFSHLLGPELAKRTRTLGQSFNMFNSTKIECKPFESHLIVPFEISGPSGIVSDWALLDTGASTTMVSAELINQTGSADLVYAPRRGFSAANGYLTCPVVDRSVGIGGIKRNIEVAVSGSENFNLLGMNFFDGLEYIIDAGNSCIYVWSK